MIEYDIPCVGICLPDEDEAYCIGCGRPWGMVREPVANSAVPPAPTLGPDAGPPGREADKRDG